MCRRRRRCFPKRAKRFKGNIESRGSFCARACARFSSLPLSAFRPLASSFNLSPSSSRLKHRFRIHFSCPQYTRSLYGNAVVLTNDHRRSMHLFARLHLDRRCHYRDSVGVCGIGEHIMSMNRKRSRVNIQVASPHLCGIKTKIKKKKKNYFALLMEPCSKKPVKN